MKKLSVHFLNLSIKNKVQYIFAVVMIMVILFTSLFFFSVTRLKLNDTNKEKNAAKLNSMQQGYNAVIETANNISKLILVNDQVLNYLRYDSKNPDSVRIRDDAVRSELHRILNSFSGNYYVFVFRRYDMLDREEQLTDPRPAVHVNNDDKRDYYVNTAMGIMTPVEDAIYSSGWYDLALGKNGSSLVIPDNEKAFENNTGTRTVSFVRIVNDIDNQRPIGLLVINIPVSELDETYKNLSSDKSVFAYVDDNRKVISSNAGSEKIQGIFDDNPSILNQNLYDDRTNSFFKATKNHVLTARKIPGTSIYMICESDNSYFDSIKSGTVTLVLLVLAMILVMLLLVSRYINRFITMPVTRLSEIMQQAESGVPVCIEMPDEGSSDEIQILQKCYNDMTLRINRLLEQVVEQEKQRQRAEMTVVQEQMKPHFLYNTLETIGYMALQNTPEEVYDAIETLGTFYRKFLSKGSETITVADEISIVKSYIKLLRLRYDDMFEDSYEIEEGLKSVMIIKLILQPLVENSIYHGIRPKGEHGEIKISIYSEFSRMHIKVYDTGVGMSQEQIRALLNGEDKKSFGFAGTINRIKAFYQSDVYVSINSTEGEYCEIDINIPK